MSNPPKRKQSKPRKINISRKDQWRNIIRDVEKQNVPIDLLLSITVNLLDGTKVNIDIKQLLSSGIDHEELETLLNQKLQALDAFIHDVNYYVSIDDVARTVQPLTDKILKDL